MVTSRERVTGVPLPFIPNGTLMPLAVKLRLCIVLRINNIVNPESEYDDQGRLKLEREIELPSGRMETRSGKHQYPADNRRRALDFSPTIRDPDATGLPSLMWILLTPLTTA